MRPRVLMLLVVGALIFMSSAGARRLSDTEDDYLINPDYRPRLEAITDLTRLVDLWHDATLKGDSRLTRKRELQIIQFLSDDIETARCRHDLCLKRAQPLIDEDSTRIGALSGTEQRLLDDVARAEQWLRAKKRLLRGFERGETFASQYRQIMDYRDVLRMEYDQWRIQVAESAPPTGIDEK